MPYQVRAFGGLNLLDPDGEQIHAVQPHSKRAAVIAYLATRPVGEAVDRGELLPLLWPEHTEEEARNSLRAVLSRLRDRLPDGALGGKGERHLWLEESVLTSDVRSFQQALQEGRPGEALSFYRGPFLEHVHVSNARPFNRWAEERRSAYRRRAYQAALTVGQDAYETGELAEAERTYRRALDLEPLKEEAAAGLIHALAAQGERTDALQLYESFRARLREELDLSASDELEELAQRIRTDSQGRTPPSEGGSQEPAKTAATGPSPGEVARRRPRSLVVGLVILLALAAGGLWTWNALGGSGQEDQESAAAESSDGTPTVAVLPFEAIGAENPGPVAKGMHGDLLTRLAKLPELDVIARTSVEKYRDSEKTAADIARELGAQWVLEGSVHQAGDEIEVNAQLIEPQNDTHAWAETYRRELSAENLFDLQRDLTRRIARSLEAQLDSAGDTVGDEPTTGSLPAHRFYIRGRSLLEQRTVPEMRRALDYFEQALAEDSSYALAWAGLADGMSVLARYPAVDSDSLVPAASKALERVLALEPEVAEAYVARARLHMYRREGPEALRDFERAVELKPSLAAAHAWRGKLRLSLGRPEAALSSAERAVELDPMSEENLETLSWALLANGRHQRALSVARDVAELEEENNTLTLVLSHLHRVEDIRAFAPEGHPSVREAPGVWLHRAAAGDSVAAADVLQAMEERRYPLFGIVAHAVLGQVDSAFRRIEEAFPREDWEWDYPFTVWLRYFWPETLHPLRDDPRYKQFLRDMNAHWGLNPDGSLPDSVNVLSESQSDS